MWQVAQKPRRKFCGQKTAKKRKTHPIWAKKGETGCVSGAGGDEHGCGQVRTDRKTWKARRKSRDGLVSAAASVGAGRSPPATSAPRHATRASVSPTAITKNSATANAVALFLAGAEGLGLGCRLGRLAAERHWRSLTPRHAPQAGLRAHLVAKSYRTLTKKSGIAEAIPDFFGRGRRT